MNRFTRTGVPEETGDLLQRPHVIRYAAADYRVGVPSKCETLIVMPLACKGVRRGVCLEEA